MPLVLPAGMMFAAAAAAGSHRDPERVCLAYTVDSEWRNRAEFVKGRDAIREVSSTLYAATGGVDSGSGPAHAGHCDGFNTATLAVCNDVLQPSHYNKF